MPDLGDLFFFALRLRDTLKRADDTGGEGREGGREGGREEEEWVGGREEEEQVLKRRVREQSE